MHDVAVDVVGRPGATRAALLPSRTEHEVVDDELAASLEEVAEGFLAVRSLEQVGLVDPDPGQLAPLGAQAIAQMGQFLLLAQELLAGRKPLVARHDSRLAHLALSSSCRRDTPVSSSCPW